MSVRMQKRLAILGTMVLVALLFVYKGYMVKVALSSQTACVVNETATGIPARRAC